MATKPTIKPQFAELDQVDPTSGQNNVIEPPTAWKDYGWTYQEKPPRNYTNWLHRMSYRWIDYFDDRCQRPVTFMVAADNAPQNQKDVADYVCDGLDDQIPINAAIAALGASGGIVLLSEGLFTITNKIAMATLVSLVGSGKFSTEIKIETDTALNFSAIDCTDCNYTKVANLKINGNAPQSTAYHHGVLYASSGGDNLVIDCHITLFEEKAGNGGNGINMLTGTDNSIIDCKIDNCDLCGVYVASGYDAMVLGCRIDDNLIGVLDKGIDGLIANNKAIGNDVNFYLYGATYSRLIGNLSKNSLGVTYGGSIQIDNGTTKSIICNNVIRESANVGIYIEDMDNCILEDNYIYLSGKHGMHIKTSDHNLIEGNYSFDNGTDLVNTYSGFYVESGVSNALISNISRGAVNQMYGIVIGGGASDTLVTQNDLFSSGATANLSGSGDTIPEWIGPDAASNRQQNNILLGNRIT